MFCATGLLISFENYLIFICLLVLILSGLMILRKIFGQFLSIAQVLKHSQDGLPAKLEIESAAAELRDITSSFNDLANRFESTGHDLDRKIFELGTLRHMMEKVRNASSAEEILKILLEESMLVSGAKNGSVLMVDQSEGRFKVLAAHNSYETEMTGGESIPIEHTLVKPVITEKKNLLVQDIETDPRTQRTNQGRYGSPSFLSMPVICDNEVIAVINLSSKENGEAFQPDDEQILSIMLDEVSFALERSKLNSAVADSVQTLQDRATALEREVQDRKKAEQALQEINVRFQALIQSIPDMIFFKDTAGKYVLVNRAFEDVTGLEQSQVVGSNGGEVLPPALAGLDETDQTIMRRRTAARSEHEIIFGGRQLVLETIRAPIYHQDGSAMGLIGVGRDITERKQAELLYENLANNLPVGVYLIQNGRFIFTNPKFREYAGLGERELMGAHPLDLVHPEDRSFVRENAVKMLKGERIAPYEFRMNTRGGSLKWIMETVLPITYQGRKAALGNTLDFTDRRDAEEALRESERRYMELSITDDLTKLFNSRHFFMQIKAEVKRTARYGHPLSIMLIDMDHFKKYNDNYGHIEGDKVLVGLGQVIRKCIRMTDTVYRYGGDEFIVILPETPGEEAYVVAERIRSEFIEDRHLFAPEGRVAVTLSIGLAQYRADEDMTDFIKRSDKNMYCAKEQGRNKVHFEK